MRLQSVEKSSDAWAKGLRSGDILIDVSASPINGVAVLTRIELVLGAGDTVTLPYLRDGERFTVEVVLIEA